MNNGISLVGALGRSPPIDVLMATYNSGDYLEDAIQGVMKCVPVHRIIAADHFSTDSTVEVLSRHGASVYFENVSLGYARQLLVEKAGTEVLMMLDSDVILEPAEWYQEALGLLGKVGADRRRVGAVVLLPSRLSVSPLQRYTNFWWRVRPSSKRRFFLTHSTLFLKEALQGITIPSQLSAAEDAFVWLHLRKRGFSTTLIEVPGVHQFVKSESKGRWMGANLRILEAIVGVAAFPFVLRNIIFYPFLALTAAIFTRDSELLLYNVRRWLGYLAGFQSYRKYRILRR